MLNSEYANPVISLNDGQESFHNLRGVVQGELLMIDILNFARDFLDAVSVSRCCDSFVSQTATNSSTSAYEAKSKDY